MNATRLGYALAFASVLFLAMVGCKVVEPVAGVKKEEALSYIASLRIHRTKAETRVVELKKKYAPGIAEYDKGSKLYTAAYAAFDAYQASLLASIRVGSKLPKLEVEGEAAVKANQDFCDYVDNLQNRPKDSLAWTTALDALVTGWEAIQKQTQSYRNQLADLIAAEIKWKKWDDVA